MVNDTQYVHKLGMSTEWKFIDVYDLSTDGLRSVPRPVAAALFLFPVSLSPQVGTYVGWNHPVVMSLNATLHVSGMLPVVCCACINVVIVIVLCISLKCALWQCCLLLLFVILLTLHCSD